MTEEENRRKHIAWMLKAFPKPFTQNELDMLRYLQKREQERLRTVTSG